MVAFGHRVLVPHVTCAEHGEAIHGASAARAVGGAVWTSRGDGHRAAITALPVASTDEHEHCSVALSRAVISHGAPVPGAALPAADSGFTHRLPVVDAAAVQTYVIAPKTSPPSVA